jgi:hypothetical protein
MCVVFGTRGFVAGSVVLRSNELLYQSKYRTYRFKREEIKEFSSSTRWWWTRSWSQPWIELENGGRKWLVDWSVPPVQAKAGSTSRFIQTAEYGKQQQMVLDVQAWLNTGGKELSEGVGWTITEDDGS